MHIGGCNPPTTVSEAVVRKHPIANNFSSDSYSITWQAWTLNRGTYDVKTLSQCCFCLNSRCDISWSVSPSANTKPKSRSVVKLLAPTSVISAIRVSTAEATRAAGQPGNPAQLFATSPSNAILDSDRDRHQPRTGPLKCFDKKKHKWCHHASDSRTATKTRFAG